jgi:hypothetical protein
MKRNPAQIARYVALERRSREGESAVRVAGILATDGETEDGHIVHIAGVEGLERGAPLLWEHGFRGGSMGSLPLGSWEEFAREGSGKPGQGRHVIRGTAVIETGGEGEQALARRDVAHMVAQGHIKGFTIRLKPHPDKGPVARVNLPSDHYAAVDANNVPPHDVRRWGAFWERSVLVEGSLTTMGADPRALVGRALSTTGAVQELWRTAAEHLAEHMDGAELDEQAGLVIVRNRENLEASVPLWVYQQLTQSASELMRQAVEMACGPRSTTARVALAGVPLARAEAALAGAPPPSLMEQAGMVLQQALQRSAVQLTAETAKRLARCEGRP